MYKLVLTLSVVSFILIPFNTQAKSPKIKKTTQQTPSPKILPIIRTVQDSTKAAQDSVFNLTHATLILDNDQMNTLSYIIEKSEAEHIVVEKMKKIIIDQLKTRQQHN